MDLSSEAAASFSLVTSPHCPWPRSCITSPFWSVLVQRRSDGRSEAGVILIIHSDEAEGLQTPQCGRAWIHEFSHAEYRSDAC
jgi:hypothetical protein